MSISYQNVNLLLQLHCANRQVTHDGSVVPLLFADDEDQQAKQGRVQVAAAQLKKLKVVGRLLGVKKYWICA